MYYVHQNTRNFVFYRSSSALAKLESELADSEMHLTKMDVVLSFQLEVIYIILCII